MKHIQREIEDGPRSANNKHTHRTNKTLTEIEIETNSINKEQNGTPKENGEQNYWDPNEWEPLNKGSSLPFIAQGGRGVTMWDKCPLLHGLLCPVLTPIWPLKGTHHLSDSLYKVDTINILHLLHSIDTINIFSFLTTATNPHDIRPH